jgi:two-component system aerobic respiration control sensor histidine kinase ArcB
VEAGEVGASKAKVTFRITDTGVGIPAGELDKIFAMYYQVDHPDHKSATGTGIGLAICKQMVDKMGGEILLHSVVGQGTCFEIVLPVAISQKQAKLVELQVSNLNILLVEDIELNVLVAKALLEKLGQRVDVAMTGTAAIEMARKTEYDLILLDIQLPDMTGFDVAKVLHDEELVLQTPIVALTANVIKKREEYLQNGMDDIITKPIKKSRVIDVFNELFGAQQMHDERCLTSEVVSIPKVDKTLDVDMLQMLVETIGEDMVRTSLGMFKEKIPEYMELLNVSLAANEKAEVCSQAHKIKGAAGSVGLLRVLQIANRIQEGEHPAWWENVHDWVAELEMAIEKDVDHLLEWVNENKIDD